MILSVNFYKRREACAGSLIVDGAPGGGLDLDQTAANALGRAKRALEISVR